MYRLLKFALILTAVMGLGGSTALAAGGGHDTHPAYEGHDQISHFPLPLDLYESVPENAGLWETISARASEQPFNVAATLIFILAIIHTFSAGPLNKLAHKYQHEHEEYIQREGLTAASKPHPDAKDHVSFKANLFHFLGEVEAVFGIWSLALAAAAIHFFSWEDFKNYLSHDRNFAEPMFVVVIMAIAASRPVLRFAEAVLSLAAGFGKKSPAAWWLSVMILAPLLGSFITEPAAMTIGAMLLAKKFYKLKPKTSFAYATLGLLFVNVSVGGTLTHFAAPPVLMVAGTWEWTTPMMIGVFGWKATIGILIASAAYFFMFRTELQRLNEVASSNDENSDSPVPWQEREDPVPIWVTIVHIFFLGWTIFNAHDPVFFVAGFLFFLAFVIATEHHQNHISMRSPLLVGFFLGALIVHGGCQGWWIQPIILSLQEQPFVLMIGATILTAFNDNAAITYLAAQVDGISAAAKYAVVAGAVTGGGLTVIANAPNPAGQSLLGRFFNGGISPGKLAAGAAIPTIVMLLCFKGLRDFAEIPDPPVATEAVTDSHHGDSSHAEEPASSHHH